MNESMMVVPIVQGSEMKAPLMNVSQVRKINLVGLCSIDNFYIIFIIVNFNSAL